MMDLTCLEADELLVAYAADALEEEDRCSVAGHLAECRNHDAELTAVRADLNRVAVSMDPVEPPAHLRTQLLAAFDEAVASGDPAEPVAIESRPSSRRRIVGTTGFAYAIAAALLVIAVGLAAWGLSRGGSESDVLVLTNTQDGASLQLTYVPSQDVGVIEVDLPQLPAGRTYQAWQIKDGAPVSLGVLDTNDGQVAMRADLSGATAIALSVEPSGGSIAPTTEPFLITPISKG